MISSCVLRLESFFLSFFWDLPTVGLQHLCVTTLRLRLQVNVRTTNNCTYSYLVYCGGELTFLGLQSRFGDNLRQTTWNLTGVSPKRDWSAKRVNVRTTTTKMKTSDTLGAWMVGRRSTHNHRRETKTKIKTRDKNTFHK